MINWLCDCSVKQPPMKLKPKESEQKKIYKVVWFYHFYINLEARPKQKKMKYKTNTLSTMNYVVALFFASKLFIQYMRYYCLKTSIILFCFYLRCFFPSLQVHWTRAHTHQQPTHITTHHSIQIICSFARSIWTS